VIGKFKTKATMIDVLKDKHEFANKLTENIVKKVLVPEILRTGIHNLIKTEGGKYKIDSHK
jgi:hypothetical protein